MNPPVPDGADLVAEVCRRVADRAGDTDLLVRDEVRQLAPLSTSEEQKRLAERAIANLRGLGELDEFLRDPDVDEVMVNAGRDIWVDRAGRLEPAGALAIDRVDHLIERVLAPIGRRVDRSSPIVDARLPNGDRVCAVMPPVAVDGPTLSIRRFAATVRTLADFTDGAGLETCNELIAARCNLLVSGATSSGKTSLVAALLSVVPPTERLVVVEDTTELALGERHAVRLEARPPLVEGPAAVTLADLVRTALRLRPDRIVVGEVRGDEVLALVQAMNTGHDGSVSTCHANSPLDALLRLESLVLQAAPTWPLAAIRQQLARSIDVIVHVVRRPSDGRRHIDSIAEVIDGSGDVDLALPAVRALASTVPEDTALQRVGPLERGRR